MEGGGVSAMWTSTQKIYSPLTSAKEVGICFLKIKLLSLDGIKSGNALLI